MIIKIKDRMSSHDSSCYPDTNDIQYIRNLIPGGDIEINIGDVVIYTDNSLTDINNNASKNIAFLIESPEVTRLSYEYISNNNTKFDTVLTFDKRLLDRGENFKLNVYGTTWLNEEYRKIWNKNKLCSFILSNKNQTSGHKFRNNLANVINKDSNFNFVDLYGGNYKHISYTTTRNWSPSHCSTHISNEKILGLKDYMFSISCENCKMDYYFTEKLIDCFLSGTVPIYYGCPSISNFFNINGIIMIDTEKDCMDILQTLTFEKYNEMMPYIQENYEKAKQYTHLHINPSNIDILKS